MNPDKTDLEGLLKERDRLRVKHSKLRNPPDRFEVYKIEGGYAILQEIPGDGPIFVRGEKVEIVP